MFLPFHDASRTNLFIADIRINRKNDVKNLLANTINHYCRNPPQATCGVKNDTSTSSRATESKWLKFSHQISAIPSPREATAKTNAKPGMIFALF